ncbi:MAG: hypothetical protein LBO69_09155 [Ignavibacteria bacterium]|nr:hypothetical protein [Ignavibacteria bacterium]
MKKLFHYLLLALFLITIVACSDDDDSTPVDITAKAYGTWILKVQNGQLLYNNNTLVLQLTSVRNVGVYGSIETGQDGYPKYWKEDSIIHTIKDSVITIERGTSIKIVYKVLKITNDSLIVQTQYHKYNGVDVPIGIVYKFTRGTNKFDGKLLGAWIDATTPNPVSGCKFASDGTYNELTKDATGKWIIYTGYTDCTYHLFGDFLLMHYIAANADNLNAWTLVGITESETDTVCTLRLSYNLPVVGEVIYDRKLKKADVGL